MSITLEGLGVVLAFCLAAASVGTWAAFMTFQVRSLKRSLCAMHERLDEFAEILGLKPSPTGRDTYGSDRHSGRVLDDSAAALRRAGL
jgi:ABC-type sulfate transport system permease component